MGLNEIHQLLTCADVADFLKKALEIVLEVKGERTGGMFISLHQNISQNYDIKTGNKSFENVAMFKFPRMT
jgi:CRISPR/Cas system type I-B associated protein Csh2 (Cas7 group RAMP superfamily)